MTNHEKLTLSLALYLREPALLEAGETRIPNPRITELVRWLNGRFGDNQSAAADFVELVKRSFRPTSTVPFPLLADLEEIYKKSNVFQPPKYQTPTMGEGLLAYAAQSGITYDPPAGREKTPLPEIWDAVNVDFNAALLRYGIKLVYLAHRTYSGARA